MRFNNLILDSVVLLTAYTAAAPMPNKVVEQRIPEADADPVEARKVYTSWYRATNSVGVTDD
ncbi:hypothetical protein VM1G_12082 [Cytospora mali]|uniref:Uncharacterized protein n=1 Tax=Cytospora mali TaxID=578113 RepID=A0A194VJT5_CYTMA|nr:hypothetical protein VM1G_12082 [Valsa mali]